MALTPLHVQDVCYGAASQQNPWGWNPTGNVCKYLTHEIVGKGQNQKFVALCLKKAPGILEDKKKKGELPADFNKLGDNCPGYRYMKYIDQGYDVQKP